MVRVDLDGEGEGEGGDLVGPGGVGGWGGKIGLAMRLWVMYTFEGKENCSTLFEVGEF